MAAACSLLCLISAASMAGPTKAGDKPAAPAPTATLRHPLDPLSEAEIHTALTTVLTSFQASQDLPKQSLTFPLMALADPAKAFVFAWKPGQPTPRIAEVQILHNPSNRVWLAEVDVPSR